jgi:hypothetical protein
MIDFEIGDKVTWGLSNENRIGIFKLMIDDCYAEVKCISYNGSKMAITTIVEAALLTKTAN